MGLCSISSWAANLSIALIAKLEESEEMYGAYPLSFTQRSRDVLRLFDNWRNTIHARETDIPSKRRELIFEWTADKLQELAILIKAWYDKNEDHCSSQLDEIGRIVVVLFTVWRWPFKLSSSYHVDGKYGCSTHLMGSGIVPLRNGVPGRSEH